MTWNKVSSQRLYALCIDHPKMIIKQLGTIQCYPLHMVQAWLPAAHHLHHKTLALEPHSGPGQSDSGIQILPEGLQVLHINVTFMGLPSLTAKLESFCSHGLHNLTHSFRLYLFHSIL